MSCQAAFYSQIQNKEAREMLYKDCEKCEHCKKEDIIDRNGRFIESYYGCKLYS